MKHALFYSIKVWLTAASITPVFAYLIWLTLGTIFNKSGAVGYSNSAASFIGTSASTPTFQIADIRLDIFESTLYSLPYLLVIFIAAYNLNRKAVSSGYKETLLTIISLLLTVTPFTFLNVVDEEAFRKLQSGILAFEAITIVGIWLYSLTPETEKITAAL
jgi:hypothetical protein